MTLKPRTKARLVEALGVVILVGCMWLLWPVLAYIILGLGVVIYAQMMGKE